MRDYLKSKYVTLAVVALSIVPVLIRLIYFPAYPGTDDSFIHAAVIKSIRAGHGWGINPGQPINLSTSPLFTIMMLGVSYLTPNIIDVGIVLSCLAAIIGIYLTYQISYRFTKDSLVGLIATVLAAANIHLWRWTGAFMETVMAYAGTLAILFFFYSLYSRELRQTALTHFFILGFSIGLLSLLRYECGLLGCAFFVHHLIFDRRLIIQRYAVAAIGLLLAFIPWITYAWLTFGNILPNTFAAKTSAGLIWANPIILSQYAVVWFSGFTAGFLIIAISIVILLGQQERKVLAEIFQTSTIFFVFSAAVFVFYYIKTPSLQSPARYLLPSMSTIPIVVAIFLVRVKNYKIAMPIATAGVFLQFGIALAINQLRVAPVLARMNTEYVTAMSEVTAQLSAHCKKNDAVLVQEDIGVVSYMNNSHCRIVDGGALATPELRDHSISEKIEMTNAHFVIESLGNENSAIVASHRNITLIWSKSFASHSVEMPNRNFVVRLFVVSPKI